MYKKTLISLAVASSLFVTGCFESSQDTQNAGTTLNITSPGFDGRVWPNFEPVKGLLPLPSDLNFDSTAADGSFGVAGSRENPVIAALNQLSGASTVAPAVVRFSGRINADTVDSRAFVNGAPNPAQNVFLLELNYASKSPVQALSVGEPPGVVNTPTNPAAGPQFTHDVVELNGASAIRILPQEPLDPLKRYLVVVTGGVQDMNGQSVRTSPTYANIKDADSPLAGPLQPIRPLLTGLWVPVAQGYLQTLAQPLGGGGIGLQNTDLALSYSFTTSPDKHVLRYNANPVGFFADQVERAVRGQIVANVRAGGATTFAQINPQVEGALADFNISAALGNDDLAPCNGPGPYLGDTIDDQFVCVGTLIKGGLTAAQITFPEPKSRNFELTESTDAALLSAVLGSIVEPGNVTVHQGFINLPYYLGVPGSTDGSAIRTGTFSVDSVLAAQVAEGTGFPIPQADPDRSTVLNYNFPFPKENGEGFTSPLLVMTPSGVTPADLNDDANSFKAVIFQHGITTDRSAALAFGASVINNSPDDVVVFAIDQPLHGISPASTAKRLELAGNLLAGAEAGAGAPEGALNNSVNRQALVDDDFDAFQSGGAVSEFEFGVLAGTVDRAGSTIPGLAPTFEQSGLNTDGPTERHFGFTVNAANNPTPMNFVPETALGQSGSLFINLTNFINNRDNLRQGSLDLMNLRATIAELDGIDQDSVYFVGHSLGTVNGAAFVGAVNASGNNSLRIAGSHLLTPVAGIVRLLENSPSFAPQILGGLQQAAGLRQGDADLETFLNVNQASLDTVDPINFASDLSGTNVLLSQVNADLVTPNAADPRFSDNVDVFNTDPLNITFPNGLRVNSPIAPLTGSEPLALLIGAENTGNDGVATPAITRYLEGVHSTPVLPQRAVANPGDVLKDRTIATELTELVSAAEAQGVFGEMVAQTVIMMLMDGDGVNGGTVNDEVIQPNPQ